MAAILQTIFSNAFLNDIAILWWQFHSNILTGARLVLSQHSRWRHQMETFSALLAICAGNSPVPGEFPTKRPVTRSFDVYFDLRPNKRLSKQSWGWWFETILRPFWRHRHVVQIMPWRWINDALVYWHIHASFGHNAWVPVTCMCQTISWANVDLSPGIF